MTELEFESQQVILWFFSRPTPHRENPLVAGIDKP
jgi:hypothetical protein